MEALPLDFEILPAAPERDDALQLSLESWEGPLDLLLALARSQKVDLKQISILALVEQYLTFIAEARELKLEVAADAVAREQACGGVAHRREPLEPQLQT